MTIVPTITPKHRKPYGFWFRALSLIFLLDLPTVLSWCLKRESIVTPEYSNPPFVPQPRSTAWVSLSESLMDGCIC